MATIPSLGWLLHGKGASGACRCRSWRRPGAPLARPRAKDGLPDAAVAFWRDRFADPSIGIRGFSERHGTERGLGFLVRVPLGGSHRRALADQTRAEAIASLAGSDVARATAAHAAWQEAHQAAQASASAAARAERGHALGGLDLSDRLYAQRLAQEAALAEVLASAEAWRAITRLRIDSDTLWMHVE